MVHHHAVHGPAAAAHLAASTSPPACVRRTGIHISPPAAATRRRSDQSQSCRLETEKGLRLKTSLFLVRTLRTLSWTPPGRVKKIIPSRCWDQTVLHHCAFHCVKRSKMTFISNFCPLFSALHFRRNISALYPHPYHPYLPPSFLSNCHPVIFLQEGAAQTLMKRSSISVTWLRSRLLLWAYLSG